MSVSQQGPEICDVIIAKRYHSQAEAVMANIEDEEVLNQLFVLQPASQ